MSLVVILLLIYFHPRCDDNVSSLSYLIDQAHARPSRAEPRTDLMDGDKP